MNLAIKIRAIAIGCLVILFSGCANTVVDRQTFTSYQVGVIKEATVGDAFIVDQRGAVETVKVWVSILYSPDGWKTEKRYSADWVRHELLYAGKSANTVEINYREFRGGYAAAPFFQTVKYDLSESRTVRFRRFVIDILSADNQTIKYRIVSDQ